MKKLLLMVAMLFSIATYSQDSKLLASCCEGKESKAVGRCSGNAYCTACTNCRYCKHCNAGGSCGVCTTYSAPVKTKKKSYKKKSYTSSSTYTTRSSYKSPSEYTYDEYLSVSSENLNVREGAGTNYDIVEKLEKGASLKFISYEGDWIEVEVVVSGNTGYVYYKYVN